MNLEMAQLSQSCRAMLDRVRDLEQFADTVRVRMEDIKQIPKMQLEIDTLEARIRTLTKEGDFG